MSHANDVLPTGGTPREDLLRAVTTLSLAVAGVLCVPLVAMMFTDAVRWGPGDFAAAFLLLFGAAFACRTARRRLQKRPVRWLAVGAVVLVTGLIWAELAVGIFA